MVTDELLQEIADGKGQPFKALCRLVPSYRNGRPATLSRLFRWALYGRKLPTGETVYLEAAKLPGGWVSTPAALARFAARCTPDVGTPESKAKPRCSEARQRAAERAGRHLEAVGIG